MKTLILNVDRDDDLGRKAKVKSPIIGIKENIDAANKLGQADPEDSDLNAIFSAISLYNSLISIKEKNVEIATICGHINVGIKSDEILAEQLENVVKETGAQDVILVTDGAEDEYILPIIQSRIKITSIKRVSVKQSRELEDTYYRVIKILNDEKVQKQFLLPIALVLIVWAIFVLLNIASSGFGAILLTLGIYLLIRVFRWERNISYMIGEIKSGLLTGKLSIYTYIIAAVILIASIFLAYNNSNFSSEVEFIPILSFISNMIWGLVVAGLLIMSGRAIDLYVKDKKAPWNYWIVPFSLFAFGFISTAIFESLHKALITWPNNFSIEPFLTLSFIGNTSTGIMIGIVGAITYHYIRDIYSTERSEIEIERQTT
jgi:putative membrane protein